MTAPRSATEARTTEPSSGPRKELIVIAIGYILLLVGGMALLGGLVQRLRAGRLGDTPFAPTGQVAAQGRAIANAKGAISTQGQLQTQQLLTSPISGAPCVYYTMRVEAEWPENGAEQKYTVVEDAQSVPFAVNDGTGHVVVSIDPKRGGEFCSTKPFARKKFSRGLLAAMGAKPLEVTPAFAIPPNVQVRGPLGRMIDVPVTANFFVTEEFLEPKGPVYVNGKLQDDGSIGSPSWTSLLVMNRSRDDLLASTTGFSKKLLLGGGIVAPIGVIVSVIGHLLAPPAAAAAPAVIAAPAMVPMGATTQTAHALQGAQGGTSLVTSALTAGGGCAGLDLTQGLIRVNNGGQGVNANAIVGTTLHRVFVKLGAVTPGQTVDVCALGRRCQQNIQVNVGSTLFINTGRDVSGSIRVSEYDVASGRMNVTFNNVTLPMNQGAGQCVLNGSLATSGLSP